MQIRFTYSHVRAYGHLKAVGSEAGPPASSADFRRIEAAGFDGIILDGGADDPEASEQAKTALDSTERLAVILPYRPASTSPAASARRFAALAGRANGRFSLLVEPGHPRDGSASHQASLERVDEYLTLLDRLWLNERPIDHEGEHYRLHRAFVGHKPGAPVPQIRLRGNSGTALQVAGRHADVFHLPTDRPADAVSLVSRVREAASMRGRSVKLQFAIPFDTSRTFGSRPTSGYAATLSFQSEVQRLASILASYRDAGAQEFVVTGLGAQGSVEAFGFHVLPVLKTLLQTEDWHLPSPPSPALSLSS